MIEKLKTALELTDAQVAKLSEIKDIQIFTSDDLETLKTNTKKLGYEEGKVAGVEISLKSATDKVGQRVKTIDELIAIYEKKIAEKVNSDDSLKEIAKEKEKLQKLIVEKENEISTLKQREIDFQKTQLINSGFQSIEIFAPENAEDKTKYITAEKSKLNALFNSNFKTEIVDGKLIVKDLNGEIVKDKLQNPAQITDVFKQLASDYNFSINPPEKSTTGGRGGTGGQGGTIAITANSYQDFVSKAEQNGLKQGTDVFLNAYADWKAAQK